jgi:hypothetical protein
VRPRAALLLAAAWMAVLAGCGYVGDPQPPTLLIPMPPQELTAMQRGAQLVVSFRYSNLTTDGVAMPEWSDAEVRIGPANEGEFHADAWAASAKRIKVPSLVTAAPVRLETAVAEFAGKEIVCGARAAGPKGRWSQWSNLVTVAVIAPLPKPVRAEAAATAEGVRLSWRADGAPPEAFFRIERQGPGEDALKPLASASASPFLDRTAEFGSEYRYRLQTVWKQGGREAESEPSDTVAITPIDTFPPAVPEGLNSILGVNSIELSWERNTEPDFRGYVIYRAAGDGPFVRIGGPIESPAYSDKAIEPGRTYRYAISAVDGAGNESPRSAPLAVTAAQ